MRHRQFGSPAAYCVGLLILVLLGLAPLATCSARPDDVYIAGYAAAILERQFNVSARSVKVKDGVLTLTAVDLPRSDRPKIISALSTIPGVARVELQEPQPGPAAASPQALAPAAEAPSVGFLPVGHLFRPLIADPRWPQFSAAYRYYIDNPDLRNVLAVSFGETLPLYRDHVGERGRWGQWETGLQAGVFSIFDLDSQSFDLMNADFFVGGFAGYRMGNFSALARLFHQSSHLGDELLLRRTRPNRINLSFEGMDAKLSYDLPLGVRAYGGGGYLVDVDPSNLGRGSAQAGVEWRSPRVLWHGWVRPIAGLDLQFREENDWHTDLSLRAGIQFESVSVLSRNLQLLLEYFNGHSFEGQFFRQPVEYLGLGVHFNF